MSRKIYHFFTIKDIILNAKIYSKINQINNGIDIFVIIETSSAVERYIICYK